ARPRAGDRPHVPARPALPWPGALRVEKGHGRGDPLLGEVPGRRAPRRGPRPRREAHRRRQGAPLTGDGRGGGAARPRGSRAHGPSRLSSTPTYEVRIRRGGNGSRPPHPAPIPGQRLLGISNDLSYLRGIDRTASPL